MPSSADALDDTDVDDLIDSYVRYTVTEDGWTLRAATPAEVDAHYASSRPAAEQTPQRDLSVTEITPLSEVGFDDWTAFGVKAANVAVLGTLGFPEGTVPDGFAVPFYFYDEFIKHNELYDDIEEMLADPAFQTGFDVQEDELKKLRKKIKKGETPDWIIAALEEMHATYPEGQSLRYRSSTNNEDLPGFSGAGLYDSKTQDPEETEEDGIDKSIKGVWESLWNFRAFTEREFHRIDHLAAAMGVLVHPNYSDELANGVAVSFDPIRGYDGYYYVNTQLGEDLVTNPDALSEPEEILLHRSGDYYEILATSNRIPPGDLLMSDDQLDQLGEHLAAIHEEFAELYSPEPGDPFAMEIEFKITSDDILAIKQARPWVFSKAPNNLPTGAPTITGTPQVGETLTAETRDINDADGLSNAVFSYQWLANDADINGATDPTYTVVADDVGKAIKVQVTFTDDRDFEESLASEATGAVVAAATSADDGTIWSATLTVGRSGTNYGFSGFSETGVLSPKEFSLEGRDYTVRVLGEDGEGQAYLILNQEIPVDFVLHLGAVRLVSKDAGTQDRGSAYHYQWDVGTVSLSVGDEVKVGLRTDNNPATGAPTIGGTAQVGETLTAVTSGIEDVDGLDNVAYSHQWLADDEEIAGATNRNYTLVDDDVGQTINVQVSFTDDRDFDETLTSAATTAVSANVPDAPEHLNVSLHDTGALDVFWEAPATDGGSAITEYRVQWKETAGNWDTPADVTEETATGTTHTITGLTDGVEYAVRIIAANDVGKGPPSDEATGTPRETTPPELSTATVAGATLTLTYDESLDEKAEPATGPFSVAVSGLDRTVDEVLQWRAAQ